MFEKYLKEKLPRWNEIKDLTKETSGKPPMDSEAGGTAAKIFVCSVEVCDRLTSG